MKITIEYDDDIDKKEYCLPIGDIKKARATMRNAFEEDGGNAPGSFKHSYISNVAMLLHDRYNVPVKVANLQAIDILDLIFAE